MDFWIDLVSHLPQSSYRNCKGDKRKADGNSFNSYGKCYESAHKIVQGQVEKRVSVLLSA